jgi:4-hydroxy-tetrahydrodipicolinate synthase
MMRAIFKEGNPTGVKAAMEIQGMIKNVLRLPLVPATELLYKEIEGLNSELG